MSVQRLLLLLVCALLPLAGLRAVWWSDVLFGKPWANAGGGRWDLGAFAGLMEGYFAAALTLALGLVLILIFDVLIGVLQRAFLPLMVIGAGLAGAAMTLIHPSLSWAGFWPLFGFFLGSFIWLFAWLQVGRAAP